MDVSDPAARHRAGYPWAGRYLERPGGERLHYLDEGQGPPVLMVHGNPSWSFLFRRLIERLRGRYRCLAPDHLGMGLSSRPPAGRYGFRLADRAGDLAALMDSLRLDQPVHLIVHDWGGPIGLSWAVDHPDQLASLTVMNTATRRPDGHRLPLRLAIFRLLGPLGSFLATNTPLFTGGTAFFGGRLNREARRGFLGPYGRAADRLAVGRFVADIPLNARHPSAPLLAAVDRKLERGLSGKPLALVWGLRDFVFTRAFYLDWLGRFPQARALALPEAGHYLLEDEPDRAGRFIEDFLRNGTRTP